jgi:hypothetical protein
MGVADDDQPSATSSGECHRHLDLGDALGLDVDFGSLIKGLRPCVVKMLHGISKGDIAIELGELLGQFALHRAEWWIGVQGVWKADLRRYQQCQVILAAALMCFLVG